MKKPLGLLIFLAVFAAGAAVVMLLWNCLIPDIIGWSSINYWQSGGLLVLSRVLIGGFHAHHFQHHLHNKYHHGHFFNDHDHMHGMGDRMRNMSGEEREEFIRSRFKRTRGCCEKSENETE